MTNPNDNWQWDSGTPGANQQPQQQPGQPLPSPQPQGQQNGWDQGQPHQLSQPGPAANNGWSQGSQPPSGWGQWGTTGAAANKPGIIPLRPLSISDLFEGSFAALRANPSVMFGLSFLVSAVLGVAQFALIQSTGLLSEFEDLLQQLSAAPDDNQAALNVLQTKGVDIGWAAVTYLAVIYVIALLGSTLLTGILTYAVSRLVIGKVTSISQALRATAKRIPGLLGLSILIPLISAIPVIIMATIIVSAGFMWNNMDLAIIIMIIAFILGLITWAYLTVKLILAPTALVLEEISVFAAIARSFTLTRRAFWSTLGRALVMSIAVAVMVQLLTSILSLPTLMITNQTAALAVSTLVGAIAQSLSQPLLSAYICLMYTDRRIRTEGFDQVLQAAARP